MTDTTSEALRDPDALRRLTAYGQGGGRIGAVQEVYVDDWSGRPEWATVRTAEGGEEHGQGARFVPLGGATVRNDGAVDLACRAEAVRTSPLMDAEQHLGLDQEQELYLHYGLTPPPGEASGAPGVGPDRPTTPVSGQAGELRDVEEFAQEQDAPPPPRLRKFVPTDPDSATAGSSGAHGENR